MHQGCTTGEGRLGNNVYDYIVNAHTHTHTHTFCEVKGLRRTHLKHKQILEFTCERVREQFALMGLPMPVAREGGPRSRNLLRSTAYAACANGKPGL